MLPAVINAIGDTMHHVRFRLSAMATSKWPETVPRIRGVGFSEREHAESNLRRERCTAFYNLQVPLG